MEEYGKKILAVTSTGSFLSVVNSSSLLIAIPSIIIDIHLSFFLAIWVIVAYSLALTVLTPVLGKYSDLVGRKRLYTSGYLVFFLGSLISSVSFSGTLILLGRIIQGIGGALLFSNSLAILTDTFDTASLGKAMGINAAIIALGTSIGPLIGGILTEFSWRWIFVFNMPIALYGFFASRRNVRDMPSRSSGKIDLTGGVLLSSAVVIAIIFMTVLPGISVASPLFLGLLAALIILISAFVYQEIQSARPIIDPVLFKIRTFLVSIIALIGGSIARFSIMFILILFLQGPLDISPLEAGVFIIPLAGSMGVMSYVSGSIKRRVSQTTLEALGLLFSGLGAIFLGLFAFRAHDYLLYGIFMVIAGAGNGLFYTPNSTVIMLSVPPGKRGETAGVRTLMLNMGSVIGLTMVFLIISGFVPSSIVNSIFLGISTPAVIRYSILFTQAAKLAFFVAGVVSIVPVPFVLLFSKK